jgi:putative nucleotidyltransferase with HDIG domain
MLVPLGLRGEGLEEGSVAPRALVAAHAAQYESEAQTKAVRDAAAAKVEDVYFPPDPNIRQQQTAKLAALLDSMRALRQRTGLSLPQQLKEAEGVANANGLSSQTLLTLLILQDGAFRTFSDRSVSALGEILGRPVEEGKIGQRVGDYVDANRPDQGPDPLPASAEAAYREVLRAFTVENVKVDEDATEAMRQQARDAQPPQVITFSRGQVVAPEGKVLEATDIEALKKTGAIGAGFDFWRAGGALLIAAFFGVGLALLALRIRPFAVPYRERMYFAAAAILGSVAIARVVLPVLLPDREREYFEFALPFPAAALVTALVASTGYAIVVALAIGLLAAFTAAAYPDIAGSGFVGSLDALELALAVAIGGAAGALVLSTNQRFREMLAAAAVTTIGVGGTMAAFWLLSEPRQNDRLPWLAGAAAISGVGSALIALVVERLSVRLLGRSPRSTLLRLAQPRHPLLRQLEAEAPGTFHHSMMVGTLAERAAERIGADSLLARVGAWYHDIGKSAAPRFYIENMLDGAPSPHEELDPEQSAEVIRQHVTEGIEIGRKHGLPEIVLDFIPQHHGTRLVTYFYRRAARSDPTIETGPFRYAGPKPQRRETAIVMLADSCEAAVRAARDVSGARIDALIDSIVAERVAEGELDECELTMRDVHEIAATFKEILRAVHHPRIQYPSPAPEELARLAGTG